jgi:hypothetical protein
VLFSVTKGVMHPRRNTSLNRPFVIPAEPVLSKVEGAGIQIPSFTGEVIFAQIRKRALDIGQ